MNNSYFTRVRETLEENGTMTVNQITTSILFNKERKVPVGLSRLRIIAVLRIMKKKKEVKKEFSHYERKHTGTHSVMGWTLL